MIVANFKKWLSDKRKLFSQKLLHLINPNIVVPIGIDREVNDISLVDENSSKKLVLTDKTVDELIILLTSNSLNDIKFNEVVNELKNKVTLGVESEATLRNIIVALIEQSEVVMKKKERFQTIQQVLTPSILIKILSNDANMEFDFKIKVIRLLGLSAVTGKYATKIDGILIELATNQNKKISLVAERTLIQRVYMYEELLKKTNCFLDKNADFLLNHLSDNEKLVGITIIRSLAKIGSSKVISILTDYMKNKDLNYALKIADVLIDSDIRTPEIVSFLTNSFANKNSMVRIEALNLLSKIDAEEVIPYFVAALNDKNIFVKIRALNLLGEMGRNPKFIPYLVEMLDIDENDVKMNVLTALGKIGTPEVIPKLIAVLDDKNVNIIMQTLLALGEIGTPEVIPYLVTKLNDENINIKIQALRSLGKTGTSEVIPYLVAKLDDENIKLRIQALDSLVKIDASKVILHLDTILADKKNYGQILVLNLLGKIGMPEVTHYIGDALKDQNVDIRIYALDLLGKIGTPDLIPYIVTALHDEDYNVRLHALYALGKIDTPEVIPHIVTAFTDKKNIVTRDIVWKSLAKLGIPNFIPSNPGCAIENFYNIGTPEAVYNMFRTFNQHEDAWVKGLDCFVYMRNDAENNIKKIVMNLGLIDVNSKSAVQMIDSYVMNKVIDLERK